MLHGHMMLEQMFYGQILDGQMSLGHLSTVMDGSTILKLALRYFSLGVGGWVKVEINVNLAQATGLNLD